MKGETKRYLRTNSNESSFRAMTHHLTEKLVTRGYNKQDVNKEIKDIKFETRETSLTKPKQTKQTRTVFITQFCDNVGWIKRIIHKHWRLIQKDPYLNEDNPLIAFRTSPNLRKKLVRAKLKPILEQEGTVETKPTTELSYPKQTQPNIACHSQTVSPTIQSVHKNSTKL